LRQHQPAVLFFQNKPAISNQPAVLFSQNKPAPAISHQQNELVVDFKGNNSPVVRRIKKHESIDDNPTKYLVIAPWGDLLQVCRITEAWRSPVQVIDGCSDPYDEVHTKEIQLHKVDIEDQKLVRITSLGDYALSLGLNSTMILATKDHGSIAESRLCLPCT
jgi:hypothetical protein